MKRALEISNLQQLLVPSSSTRVCLFFHLQEPFHLPQCSTVKFLSVVLLSASIAATVQGAQVEFFSNKACDSASQTYQGDCNFCADPPGDWGAVRFSDIPSNYRVTVHNQNSCTSASQVGQGFGPACWLQGGTKLRSAWVACPGQKLTPNNSTEVQDAEEIPE